MRTRHFLSRLGAIALLLAGASLSSFGQNITTGDIAGTVRDATGAVVPGATVTLKNIDSGESRAVQTDTTGAYRFPLLKPGNYTISAASAGLISDTAKLAVSVGQTATLDLVAKVQTVGQTIEVTGTAELLNSDNANLSSTFTSKQMEELPTAGGDMTTIAFTAPGVEMSTGMGYGNFTSHGLPAVSNLFTINGNDYNDAFLNLNNSGASNLLLGTNEVQEAAVVQNAYSVQYGREAGAQVNYITKSGTNGFHGDATWNWNGDRLNANDYFQNTYGNPKGKAISNQWAADFGGPIKKDKLFFYADTEGLYYTLPAAAVVTIPSAQLQAYALANVPAAAVPLYQTAFKIYNGAPGVSRAVPITNGPGALQDGNGNLGCGITGFAGTPAPNGGVFGVNVPCGESWAQTGSNTNKEHLYTFRGDYNITDKQKVYGRLKHDDGFQPTSTNQISPIFNEQSIQPEWDGSLNYTYVISPTIVNSAIASVLWYSAYFGPPNVSASQQLFPTEFSFGDGGSNGGGFYPMGSNWGVFPQGRDVGQGQLIDDLSITHGRHNIKVGENYRYDRVSDFGLLTGTTGAYSFNSLTDFATGVTDPNYFSNYFQKFDSITTAHSRLYNIGVYAQDEWAAMSNLKITFGLRLDRTGNPQCVDNCFSRFNAPFDSSSFQKGADVPYNSSIQTGLSSAYYAVDSVVPQPRVGIVWSPKGDNNTVLRGGFGLFADLPPAFLIGNLYNQAPYPFGATIANGASVGPVTAAGSAPANALAEFTAFKTGFFGGQTLAQLNNSVPGGFSPFGYFDIPSHLNTPTFAEWSFEVERRVGDKNVAVATYTGNHGYNLMLQNGFPNAAALGGTFAGLPSVQPDPRFTTVTSLQTNGISNYDGLTVQFRRAFSHGFQGQVNYTWSHDLDYVSNGGSGLPFSFANNNPTNLVNPNLRFDYGNSDYDIRNSLQGDFLWDMPWKLGNKALNYALGGWTFSSKLFLRSGVPETITDSLLGNLFEGTLNASLTPEAIQAVPHYCGNAAVNGAANCLTSAMFLPAGTEPGFGNIGRNTLFGPGYFNIDSALFKNFDITERVKLTIGASAFNILNHAHFADPDSNVASGGLGGIYGTVEEPTSAYGAFQGSVVTGRVMVLTAKLKF
ncbi:MAG TPA: carboxypeptidase regulatory-like domain-containing protein [Bryobacteraceae bacterium]|nr:carboxypeptidase regulatory-like domain-containing protein [Bryobacteraceae bacterium]